MLGILYASSSAAKDEVPAQRDVLLYLESLVTKLRGKLAWCPLWLGVLPTHRGCCKVLLSRPGCVQATNSWSIAFCTLSILAGKCIKRQATDPARRSSLT